MFSSDRIIKLRYKLQQFRFFILIVILNCLEFEKAKNIIKRCKRVNKRYNYKPSDSTIIYIYIYSQVVSFNSSDLFSFFEMWTHIVIDGEAAVVNQIAVMSIFI